MLTAYFNKINELLTLIEKEEGDRLRQAARKVTEGLQKGGIVQLFGCGHSHILTEEVFYRAGGLVPVKPILIEPLMLHEGAVRSSELERENGYASTFLQDYEFKKEDVVFVLSTSGRNPVPVDVALYAKAQGAFVIGVTSLEYSQSQPSRHVSGKRLYEVVDLVIDNHAPVGDAVLSHPKVAVPFAPSSTVTGAAILNGIFAETIALLAESGSEPPIFLSGNIEGADTHNKRLVEQYRARIPL
ncbi:SIS domain-containing protein [Caenibacillus caldisaponilyticus]|uniref:SIS domain-containing protein n=1 Tax=Caenibacillus caldisaponilyticus TaxID=1674942 RepID=UPI0009888904|nr:SIS domain-containing protein [Caenibacillus caldisaponilyticus]